MTDIDKWAVVIDPPGGTVYGPFDTEADATAWAKREAYDAGETETLDDDLPDGVWVMPLNTSAIGATSKPNVWKG